MDSELFHDKFILVKRKCINGNKYKFTFFLCAVIFQTHFPASIKPTLKTLEQCVKSD